MSGGAIATLDTLSFNGSGSQLNSLDTLFMLDSGSFIDMNGGDIDAIDDIEIDGTLNHDGTLLGFYGVTPVVRQDVPLVGILLFEVVATLSDLLSSLQRQGLITTNV